MRSFTHELCTMKLVNEVHHYVIHFISHDITMYLLNNILCCSQLGAGFQKAQLYYATYSRFGPWIIGVIFGYLVYEAKRKELKLSLVIQYSLTFTL
jgi:hypothetical protein